MKRAVELSQRDRDALWRAMGILATAGFDNTADELNEYISDAGTREAQGYPVEMLQAKLDDLEFWHVKDGGADPKMGAALKRIAPKLNAVLAELSQAKRNPSRALTYADFERTGWQDCDNVIDLDNFEWDAGSAEDVLASGHWLTAQEWIDTQDDFEGLDPKKAYRAWLAGGKECALGHIEKWIARSNPAAKTRATVKSKMSGSAQRVVTTIKRDDGFPKLVILTPKSVVDALDKLIGDRSTEFFATVYVNPRNIVIGYDLYTSGSVAGVEVHPQGIIANAIGVNASAIVTAHNHPSGDAEPSVDDKRLWLRLREACFLMGIVLLDNLVIGSNGTFYSESEST